MPDADPPILVSGGSVTLKVKADELPEQSKGHYYSPDRKLRRITISGDGVTYSKDFPTGDGVTIKIFFDNSVLDGGGGGGK
ncbi:MAG: hypothetical protein LC795_16500 [Acidobacteria bacterium]|nr:hypothetical protein [Acidobacteriota bacterium]